MARALIVGCGCRGRELAAGLLAGGWVVRGTSRRPEALVGIEAAGGEAVLADPDRVGEVLEHIGDVTLVAWLMGSATGDAAAVAALHGARLERLLEEIVDTPVRGVIYEAGGSADPAVLANGSRIVAEASERWRIPVAVVDADPADPEAWRAAMLAAAGRLIAG